LQILQLELGYFSHICQYITWVVLQLFHVLYVAELLYVW